MRSHLCAGLVCAAIGLMPVTSAQGGAQSSAQGGADGTEAVASGAPIEAVIPCAPTLAAGTDHRNHLVYELHLTNFATVPMTLNGLDVRSGASAEHILTNFSADALDGMISHPGLASQPKNHRVIEGGARVIVYVWLSLNPQETAPRALLQKLFVSAPDSDTGKVGNMVMDIPQVVLPAAGPLILTPPLKGTGWEAVNGPSNSSVHRRAAFPYNGATTIAERYAYDFVQLGDDGSAFKGDKANNSSWKSFGAEVFAVADGTVVDLLNGIPENVPLSPDRPVEITPRTSGGNSVTVDIGRGHFAFFAHLHPGSIRVAIGDHVRSGQVLGLLGNTGNSTNAHLHFHVSTAVRPGEGEGVPVVFAHFHLLGRADFLAAAGLAARPIGWSATADSPANERHNEMPLENDVLSFSNR
jgi:hypothetical protein